MAAKALTFKLAMTDEFRSYASVVKMPCHGSRPSENGYYFQVVRQPPCLSISEAKI